MDGSGYPNHLKGDKIHYSAQICGICDIFDAMTNDNCTDLYAVEFLHTTAGIYFDKEYVKEFLTFPLKIF